MMNMKGETLSKIVRFMAFICICLIPLYGKDGIIIKMNSGREYYPAQLAGITNDSIEIWVNTSTIVLAQTNISSISIHSPNVTIIGTCLGSFAGLMFGVWQAESLEGVSRFAGPGLVAIDGLVGSIVGTLVGFLVSQDRIYNLSKMTDEGRKLFVKRLYNHYAVSRSG